MATDITKLDYAVVLKKAVEMRDLADDIINMLVPDGDEPPACRHPVEKIRDLAGMVTIRCTAATPAAQNRRHPFILRNNPWPVVSRAKNHVSKSG